MKILIIKLGAAGDVVRTTCLLRVLRGEIHWLISDINCVLLEGVSEIEKLIVWRDRNTVKDTTYDLVINLEDSVEAGALVQTIRFTELFGAYLDNKGKLTYTDSSKEWFDLSLISRFGKEKADELKLRNRHSYQDLVFRGLGHEFRGEKYFLPKAVKGDLTGAIAISHECGSVWPMKNWAYYNDLKRKLEGTGLIVNFLPIRKSITEHIGDIQSHQYLISGDSLPMHIALGSNIKCLTIFTCTSPWEICDYGIQKKVISTRLNEYFYKRHLDINATTCIALLDVYRETLNHLGWEQERP